MVINEKIIPTLSVCVPVYNKEKVIRRCLDSLKNQTFHDIEFIIIDDGSMDRSGEICDQYAKEDNRFKIIHQENQGVGAARKRALEEINGKFFIFCDADDWVESDAYEIIVNKAEEKNADIVIFGYYRDEIRSKKSKKVIFSTNSTNNLDIISDLIKSVNNSTCNKLIRTSFIKENDISFPIGIDSGEDFLFISKAFLANPQNIEILEIPLYHYCCDSQGDSLTHYYNLKTVKNQIEILKWRINNLNFGKFKKLTTRAIIGTIPILLKSKEFDKKLFQDFIKEYLPWSLLLSSKINKKWLLAFSCKLFGIGNVYKFVKKVKN